VDTESPFLTLKSYSTTLLVSAIDRYGLDMLTWAPETIEMELRDDFRREVPRDNLLKLMVAIDLLNTNSFFQSPTDFCMTCATLSGYPASDGQLILPDADDMAWGVTEALLLTSPEDQNPFSVEITALMGEILHDEAILVPPDVLRIAVRPEDLAERARYNFSDDPEMFKAVFEQDKGRTDDINKLLASRLHGLLRQLRRLPYRSADSANVAKLVAKLAAGLPAAEPVDLVPN